MVKLEHVCSCFYRAVAEAAPIFSTEAQAEKDQRGWQELFGTSLALSPDGSRLLVGGFCVKSFRYCPGFVLQYERAASSTVPDTEPPSAIPTVLPSVFPSELSADCVDDDCVACYGQGTVCVTCGNYMLLFNRECISALECAVLDLEQEGNTVEGSVCVCADRDAADVASIAQFYNLAVSACSDSGACDTDISTACLQTCNRC